MKTVIKVENEEEFRAVMNIFDKNGWNTFMREDMRRNRFKYGEENNFKVCVDYNDDYFIQNEGFCRFLGYEVIDFEDFNKNN